MKTLTLSQAIREGAKLRPQNFGWYFDHKAHPPCSCVWGAAIEAVCGKTKIPDDFSFSKAFPVSDRKESHPVTGNHNLVFGIMVNLNDKYKWTREEIADWVETIENQMENEND